jgi:hypothetical protein
MPTCGENKIAAASQAAEDRFLRRKGPDDESRDKDIMFSFKGSPFGGRGDLEFQFLIALVIGSSARFRF